MEGRSLATAVAAGYIAVPGTDIDDRSPTKLYSVADQRLADYT